MSSPFSSCQKGKGRGRGSHCEKSSPSPSGDTVHGSSRRNDDERSKTSSSAESRKSRTSAGRGRARRPEMQLYVPRGRRSQTDSPSQVTDDTSNGSSVQDRLEPRDEEVNKVTSRTTNVHSKNSRRKEKETEIYVPKARRQNINDEDEDKSHPPDQTSSPDPAQLPNPVLKKFKTEPSGDYLPCTGNSSTQDMEENSSALSDILPPTSNSTSIDKGDDKPRDSERATSKSSKSFSEENVTMPLSHDEGNLEVVQPLDVSLSNPASRDGEVMNYHPKNMIESSNTTTTSNLLHTDSMKNAQSDADIPVDLANTKLRKNSSDDREEISHSESNVNENLNDGGKDDIDMNLLETDDKVGNEITSIDDKKDVLGSELQIGADTCQEILNTRVSTELVSDCKDITVDGKDKVLDEQSKETVENSERLNGGEKIEEDEVNDDESWDKLFDDNGDCLEPSLMEELTAHVGEVQIEKPSKINYLAYQPKDPDLSSSAFSHLIEIYDFPADFTTRDLLTTFQSYMSKGFDIKWVDDTHAIGVFSSAIAAQDALKMIHPLLKLRPIEMASKQAKLKAKRTTEFLLPYKERPKTTAIAARRLVSGALGLSSKVSKEKSEQEKIQLREAKEKRRNERKLKQDIWDGSFGKCAMDES